MVKVTVVFTNGESKTFFSKWYGDCGMEAKIYRWKTPDGKSISIPSKEIQHLEEESERHIQDQSDESDEVFSTAEITISVLVMLGFLMLLGYALLTYTP